MVEKSANIAKVYFIDDRNSYQVATHHVINKLAGVYNAILVIVFHIESNVQYIYLLRYYYHYLVIVIILNACVYNCRIGINYVVIN